MRKKHSSNRDPRALRELTKGEQFYAVNLEDWKGSMAEIGEEAESIITNSKHLASVIEKAACSSCEEVERAIAKQIKGPNWKSDVPGSEQHMKEEDEVSISWQC